MIGSSFRLYWQDLWRFILLGIAVAFWQPLLVGIMQIGVLVLLGVDPRNGTIQPVNGILQPPLSTPGNSTAPPSPVVHLMSLTPQQIAALVGASVLLMLLLLFFSVWQVSALSIAARESILGRPARTGAAMLGGLKRMPSVLGTMLLVFLILVGIMLVLEVGIIAAGARLIAVLASSLDEIAPAAYLEIAGITVAVMVFYVVLLVTSLYVSVRLQFAASAAAGDRLSPGRALGRSWVLTRGNWWRSFLPGLAMSVVAGSAGMGASSGAVVSPIVVYLFVTPLLTAVLAPLMVITFMVVYYDLRLRREGYLPLAKELGMPVFSPPFPGPTVPPSPPPQVDGSTQRGRSPSA